MKKYRFDFVIEDDFEIGMCDKCPVSKGIYCEKECPLKKLDINSYRNLHSVEKGKYNLYMCLKGEVHICDGKVIGKQRAIKMIEDGKKVVFRKKN